MERSSGRTMERSAVRLVLRLLMTASSDSPIFLTVEIQHGPEDCGEIGRSGWHVSALHASSLVEMQHDRVERYVSDRGAAVEKLDASDSVAVDSSVSVSKDDAADSFFAFD